MDGVISIKDEYPAIMVIVEGQPFTITLSRSEGATCGIGQWKCVHVHAIHGNGSTTYGPSHPRVKEEYRAECREFMSEAFADGLAFILAIARFGEGYVT